MTWYNIYCKIPPKNKPIHTRINDEKGPIFVDE